MCDKIDIFEDYKWQGAHSSCRKPSMTSSTNWPLKVPYQEITEEIVSKIRNSQKSEFWFENYFFRFVYPV